MKKKLSVLAVTAALASGGLASLSLSAQAFAADKTSAAVTKANAPVAERLKALDAILTDHWEYNLRSNPEYAS
ncbi:MAG: hypothetical protein E6Q34_01660, partial [Burkholderiaceae bacterium]